MDDSEPKSREFNWRPLASALIAAAAGLYAWRYGLTALPPIISVLLLGCTANVLYGLLQWLKPTPNVLIDALKGISQMLSFACFSILLWSLLWAVFAADQNPFTRLATAEDAWALGLSVFVLAFFLVTAAMGLLTIYSVWLMVRHDVLGKNADASVAE